MILRKPISSMLLTATLVTSTIVFAGDNAGNFEQELNAFNDQYNDITAAYDIDAFLSLYADGPLWIAPENAPVQGLDVPKATFEFFSNNEGSLTHTLDHTYASDDGTQAIMIGQYNLNIKKVGVIATGTYQFVLTRDGESWKIVSDMYNQHVAK